MNRIDDVFRQLKNKSRKAFIAYITGGDPDIAITEKLAIKLAETGVDLIEIGVPFSDPMADGPVNQRAAQRALASGTTLRKIIKTVKDIRVKSQIPVILFTYFNPVFQYGIDKFSHDARKAGIDGILIVDLPPEEAGQYQRIFKKYDIKMIYLVAPTSGDERIEMICRKAEGFIYVVSRTGVTGAKKDIPKEIPEVINCIKKNTDLPVAVGFGVSNRNQVDVLQRIADGVVVGSTIVNQIEKNIGKPDLVNKVADFVKELIPE